MISNAVKHRAAGALAAACLALGWMQGAHAVPVSILAMKLSDSTSTANDLPAWEGWRDAGGFNEDNAAAQLLIDNALDYKNSIVDTSWADVLSVRVSMYRLGVEQKFIEFSPGTTKMNFFTAANVTASSYLLSDLDESHNFFSIQGDSGIERHWFINQSYPGCEADVGNWVVLDRRAQGAYVCAWEDNRVGVLGRGFLYAPGNQEANWNNANVGIADVYAVHITIDSALLLPAPAPLALTALGLVLLGLGRRNRRPPAFRQPTREKKK